MFRQLRKPHQQKASAQRGQATIEFWFVVCIGLTILLMVLPLIGDVIKQKSDDVHARQQATILFDHGKYLGEINLPNVFLPDLTISQLIPNLPGFGIPDFSSVVGLLGFFGINTNIMDFLGFDGADSIMGNAFNQGAIAYITSGFNSDAGLKGALQGAIQSDQFGRWADSQWNGLFGNGSVAWEDSGLQKGWGDNISWSADFSGSYTQGFLSAYVASDGDIKSSMIGGFSQGWMIKPVQDWLGGVFDGKDFWVGVTNGGVQGTLAAVGSGGDNALLTIGSSMASGGFMSKTVQGSLFGTNDKGGVMSAYDASFGRGFSGSAINGAFRGALAYAGSGDIKSLYLGAAIGAASFTAGSAYRESGAKQKVDDTTQAVTSTVKGWVKSGEDASGVTDLKDGAKKIGQDVNDTTKQMFNGDPKSADQNPSPGAPPVPEQAQNGSLDGTSGGHSSSGAETHDKAVADTVNQLNTKKSDSSGSYVLALAAVTASLIGKNDKASGQSGNTTNPAAETPKKNNTPENGSDPNANPQNWNNPPVAQNNPPGSGNNPVPTATAKITIGGIQSANATPNSNSTVNNASFNNIPIGNNSSFGGNRFAQAMGGVRMPQDVNISALGSSKLVADLKTHRNEAVDMVKNSIEQRLMDDYQQQLINDGIPSSQAASLLNDPKTKERMKGIVDDPRVEEAVKQLIDEALQDETFMAALVAAKDDLVKQQALIAQLKMREIERAKTSRGAVYSRPEENKTPKSLIERLRSIVKDWEIWS